MTRTPFLPDHSVSSAELASAIAAADFSGCAATVVGYGAMGTQYVKALQALGLHAIRVCSRSAGSLEALRGLEGIETLAGGFESLESFAQPDEVGIIATPIATLIPAVARLVSLGFRRLLIEKPVASSSGTIAQLAGELEQQGVEAACAYNRVAYPSFHEVKALAAQDGGITSCTYTFTEMIKPDWPMRYSSDELARWGIANSLHVISMAHGLIGLPGTWTGYRSGALPWHPTGAVFVGCGTSDQGLPFAYHADWGSTGRWSVEVHTRCSSYRLCPLERVFRRTSATSDWVEVPVRTFAPQVKAGMTEQVAAMLHPDLRAHLPLVSLRDAAALTSYGEDVFGYEAVAAPLEAEGI